MSGEEKARGEQNVHSDDVILNCLDAGDKRDYGKHDKICEKHECKRS